MILTMTRFAEPPLAIACLITSLRKYIKNPKIILPQTYDENAHVWHVFVVRCDDRVSLQKYLEDNGIQTNIHYPTPPHLQGAYKEWRDCSYPITEKIHREVLSLPVSPVMTDEEIKSLTDNITESNEKLK